MAQWARYLLCELEDLKSGFLHPWKKSGMAAYDIGSPIHVESVVSPSAAPTLALSLNPELIISLFQDTVEGKIFIVHMSQRFLEKSREGK